MSKLEDFVYHRANRFIHKGKHYLDIYEQYFDILKHEAIQNNRKIHLLEIGVERGGSLEMWIDYFGVDHCLIYGMDIDPNCKKIEEFYPNIKIFIGDQANREFLQSICQQIPKLDIIIDDGGHHMKQQIITFEVMFWHLNYGGVFLVEDLHTSYWSSFGGGYKNPNSFIEYIKGYIDKINAYHSRNPNLTPDQYTRCINGIHFYDSVVVITKLKIERGQYQSIISGSKNIDGSPLDPVKDSWAYNAIMNTPKNK